MFEAYSLENIHYSNTNKLNFTGYPSSLFSCEYKCCAGMYIYTILGFESVKTKPRQRYQILFPFGLFCELSPENKFVHTVLSPGFNAVA